MEHAQGITTPEADKVEARVMGPLHRVVLGLTQCPQGPVLDALGLALCRLASQCRAHADSVAAAAEPARPETVERAVRARLLAAVADDVWAMVRSQALGADAAALDPAERRDLDAALRRLLPARVAPPPLR